MNRDYGGGGGAFLNHIITSIAHQSNSNHATLIHTEGGEALIAKNKTKNTTKNKYGTGCPNKHENCETLTNRFWSLTVNGPVSVSKSCHSFFFI